ncbi:MAG: acetoin utilization protein AcuC [Thermoplasmata archaeon]|jgi:acetoin utilization protein AcuC
MSVGAEPQTSESGEGGSLSLIWDDRFRDYDFGPEHPFTERSRALAVSLLRTLAPPTQSAPVTWVGPVAPAPRSVLESFHRREYVTFVEAVGAADQPTFLDSGDTPGFPGCFAAAARVVAGADRGLELTLAERRPAFHPAGGLHHAHPDRASGFCIFNDVAIAVGRAVREHRRVAYIDIDAHHGDGVMYGFYDSGRVLDIDFHQDGRTLFPGTGFPPETGRGDGAGLKVNLPLPPGAGDGALLPLFRRVVPSLLRSFRPEVIVLQHGVDGHVDDALARLQYTPAAYAEIDRTVLALAREVSGSRLLVTGGGGYRASSVSRVLARAGLILAGFDLPADEEPLPDAWRAEFFEEAGETAPATWGGSAAPVASSWNADHESKLIAVLEEELGQRFSSSD